MRGRVRASRRMITVPAVLGWGQTGRTLAMQNSSLDCGGFFEHRRDREHAKWRGRNNSVRQRRGARATRATGGSGRGGWDMRADHCQREIGWRYLYGARRGGGFGSGEQRIWYFWRAPLLNSTMPKPEYTAEALRHSEIARWERPQSGLPSAFFETGNSPPMAARAPAGGGHQKDRCPTLPGRVGVARTSPARSSASPLLAHYCFISCLFKFRCRRPLHMASLMQVIRCAVPARSSQSHANKHLERLAPERVRARTPSSPSPGLLRSP
ncbi:hypothetical protein BCR34DRAFT_320863 [Clohesyomyces aquaticus]|uniref:Uncharacterized protein n=1 Tax=Clohesyomyces aquaticus TaxID=1231657 RepID=A0A1Y2A7N4_9PLEO|nr:hypothetical protein BCR34DRAFT_320863 [Clohesyomyces aquaticus]